jgi:hypothetical protein
MHTGMKPITHVIREINKSCNGNFFGSKLCHFTTNACN